MEDRPKYNDPYEDNPCRQLQYIANELAELNTTLKNNTQNKQPSRVVWAVINRTENSPFYNHIQAIYDSRYKAEVAIVELKQYRHHESFIIDGIMVQ